ncbi:MAG: bifunctional diguanylate cyclase/phosphodiesterase [Nakamurella sp.]
MTVKLTLDDLVTSVATELMGVTAATLHSASERLLHQLVDYFEVDLSFLRRNDHELGATVLVAEWPPRPEVPIPDPLGVIFFATADPTFASLESLSSVLIVRPTQDHDEYQDRVRQGSGIQGVSLATVPLMTYQTTSGTLGFIKYGDRAWEPEEINALRAVAALLAQLQARVAAEERLRYLAYHDELTGLATRRALTDHLTARLVAGAPGPVPVIFIDVDRLKALNSFLGHAAGDQFLATLAHRLKNASPRHHLLARLGGDEFVAIMDGPATVAEASEYADTLRRVANLPVQVGGEEISRAVSIGLALGDPGVSNVSELMNQADQAMQKAKSHGGNDIAVFTAEMRRQNEIRTDIELHLVTAIRSGSLILHYQPEVDMVTGELTGIEALVRWPHPNLGLLPPGAFIDVIETTNLAGELGRWVIETGCRQLREWHLRFPQATPISISVNVTPAELITRDFVATVAQILADVDLEGRYLTLEITEQAIVRDTEQALATLRGLKAIGVKVAIDDFGTGYSSLAQLKSLPVDGLKIDRGFVQDLGTSADDLAIVRSIIGLAGSFGLNIVAEGVETELAAATLVALGCTRAQGFLYAKPCGADELANILEMKRFAIKRML